MRSKVHVELYKRLDNLNINQVIYTPERDMFPPETNSINSDHSFIIYSKIIQPYHSLLFHQKINTICNDLEIKVDVPSFDGVHATTLFSDGAVALRIKKKYHIPYIVSVRNTDVNTFIKLPYLWPLLRELLTEASMIVCVSPSIRHRLLNSYGIRGMKELVETKTKVITNGINDWWIENIKGKHKKRTFGVAYVGRFMKNKNIDSLIDAVLQLRKQIPEIRLNLIGGGGDQTEKIIQKIKEHPDCLKYHGYLTNKEEIGNILEENDVFAMASFRETFGLVYIEAMSQGLPVLYTKGQGIDGLFSQKVGESVNPNSKRDIIEKLRKMLLDINSYHILSAQELESFNWNTIACQYKELYIQYFNQKQK